jgi:hypothetical protein
VLLYAPSMHSAITDMLTSVQRQPGLLQWIRSKTAGLLVHLERSSCTSISRPDPHTVVVL